MGFEDCPEHFSSTPGIDRPVLINYTVRNWGHHVIKSKMNVVEDWSTISSLLQDKARICCGFLPWESTLSILTRFLPPTPSDILQIPLYFGLTELFQHMIVNFNFSIHTTFLNKIDRIYRIMYDESITLLTRAVIWGQTEIVKFLLENGADMEWKDEGNNATALVFGAREGHLEVVKLLLEKGANIESMDRYGRTALSWAAKNGHEQIAEQLLKTGAMIESRDKDGATPLILAVQASKVEVVRLLLGRGADTEAEAVQWPSTRQTALLYAANKHKRLQGSENALIARLLLENGANANKHAQDILRETALIRTARYNNTAVAETLLEHGADIEAKNSTGKTALASWAIWGGTAIVRCLLEKGADFESRQQWSDTTLCGSHFWSCRYYNCSAR
jgi:ankyrin repeat protein